MPLSMTIVFAILLGLIVGSFLTVLIVRYPAMLESQWRRDCQSYLHAPLDPPEKINLWIPRSRCPHCETPLKLCHNIPLFSFCFLRGRCAYCQKRISALYPAVEFLTAILTVFMLLRFEMSTQLFPVLIFTWTLIALFFIDLRHHLLPDTLTLIPLWLGLLLSIFHLFVSPKAAIIGAILGYGVLWVTAYLFKLVRKKEGMGHGDFKMLAMIGTWFGPMMVLNSLLLAVILALLTSILLLVSKRIRFETAIPFGSFLAVGGWISLLSHEALVKWLIPM